MKHKDNFALFQGLHNASIEAARQRISKGQTYKDLSTVVIIPTRGMVHMKVLMSWRGLIQPMNQKVFWLPVIGMEVGEAYNWAVEQVLANPELSKWKYILTLEEDNMPPPDGLMRLYEGIEKFDVVGGLYWTKGVEGQPMIYGNPGVMPKNFIPQMPTQDALQEANGLGMGFNLFKMSMFKKIQKPWFKTLQHYEPGVGTRMYTQDLYFYENAAKSGFKFACDTRVKVGHFDAQNDMIW